METGDRASLPIPGPADELADDLDDFAPRAGQGSRPADTDRRAVDRVASFPSREPSPDIQLNLKGPRDILERFKAMCKADRRPYYDMLEILMDSFEGGPRKER